MSKLFISASIAFVLILSLGAYFFTRGNELNDLKVQRAKLQSDLSLAKDKLDEEKSTMETIISGFKDTFGFGVNIQDQMKQASQIVAQTDFMFTEANSSNPQLAIDNVPTETMLNEERKNINLLLAKWQKQLDASATRKIGQSETEQIKKEVEMVKAFLENLAQMVANLTPENSGLYQFQIDAYVAQLPPIAEIDKVLASLNSLGVPNSVTAKIEDPDNIAESLELEEEVTAQQFTIREAENRVTAIQEQITQVEAQIEAVSPSPVSPIPTVVEDPVAPIPEVIVENPNTDNVNDNKNNLGSPRMRYDNIIIQPGPPRLIQGTDPY